MGRGARNGLLAAVAAAALSFCAGAQAAFSPTAISVDSSGTAYVGDGTSNTIRVFDSKGTLTGSFGGVAGVIALKVDSSKNVWVLDTLNRVQEFSATGTLLRAATMPFCDRGSAPFAPGGGGIDVSSNSVWVASPCSDKLYRFGLDLAGPSLTVPVASPHGVAVQGDEVSVGRWNNLDVAVFDAGSGAQKRLRAVGFQPADVFVDSYDVLFATDIGTDTIGMFGSDGVKFRTLGRTGSNPGDLLDPWSFDVAKQDIGDASGNLYLADYGNQRIQRWNSYGYTFFAKPVDGTGTVGGGGGTGTTTTTTTTTTPTTPGGGGTGTPTSIVGVTINDAAVAVSSPNVTLKISPPAGASGVLLSNDGGFGAAVARPIASDGRYAWTLQSSGAERLPKTVYVRFTGTPDPNVTFTDDVILDQAPPRVTSATVAPATTRAKRPTVSVRVKARDAVSGVAQLQIANRKGPSGAFVAYAAKVRVSIDSASGPVYVRAIDHAGNAGAWIRARRTRG